MMNTNTNIVGVENKYTFKIVRKKAYKKKKKIDKSRTSFFLNAVKSIVFDHSYSDTYRYVIGTFYKTAQSGRLPNDRDGRRNVRFLDAKCRRRENPLL